MSSKLEDGDLDELLSAIGDIAKAKGMTQIAKDTGLGRESLYKSLTVGAKPRFDTIHLSRGCERTSKTWSRDFSLAR